MDQATWDLILRNLWPMLRATVTATIPLTTISFVLALFVALARISRINPAVPAGAGVRLGDPGDAAAGAAVHCLLRAAAVRDRHRPRSRRR
jgi:ABC-type amino acid transport system permease subunit